METLLLFLYIIISVSLVGLILLQQSKGSDIGSAFGGGSSNTMFGPNSSLSPLAKITAILAVIFLVLSFYLTLQSRNQNNETILEEVIVQPQEEGILPDTIPE
jgi:preprotein translocase subunit SecG|tara:strand:+ start:424 stop:732 length:309 start_codon:yes stop_codon:yes gene_type:complete